MRSRKRCFASIAFFFFPSIVLSTTRPPLSPIRSVLSISKRLEPIHSPSNRLAIIQRAFFVRPLAVCALRWLACDRYASLLPYLRTSTSCASTDKDQPFPLARAPWDFGHNGHRERPLPSNSQILAISLIPIGILDETMAPKTPRLKILSGLSSHPMPLFSQHAPPPSPRRAANMPTLALRPSQTFSVLSPSYSFVLSLAWPKQFLPIESNFLSLFFFSCFSLSPQAPQLPPRVFVTQHTERLLDAALWIPPFVMGDNQLMRICSVGGNPVSAFLSWRLQATNACDVTLVWKSGFEHVAQYGISFKYVVDAGNTLIH